MLLSHFCITLAVWINHWNWCGFHFSVNRINASRYLIISVWKDLKPNFNLSDYINWDDNKGPFTQTRCVKTSLTFKCLIEYLLADFSYSRPLDTYLWKQMMKMNRNITYKWCNIAKKHLLFTKRKCHKFSWLFTASHCSPRRRSICACRIAWKVLVSIGL